MNWALKLLNCWHVCPRLLPVVVAADHLLVGLMFQSPALLLMWEMKGIYLPFFYLLVCFPWNFLTTRFLHNSIWLFFPACLWICQPLLSCLSTRGSWPLASASITSKISLLASTAHPLWEAPLTTQRLMATAWIKHNYCLSCNKILNKKQNKNIIHQNYYY